MPASVNIAGGVVASVMPPELALPEDDVPLLLPLLPLLPPLLPPLLLPLPPLLVPLPLDEPLDEPELPPLPPSKPLVPLLHPGDEARATKDETRQAIIVCQRISSPFTRT
jgi:hypothetical protein